MYIGDVFIGYAQQGNKECYYCGAKCNDEYSIDEYVKKNTTVFSAPVEVFPARRYAV